MNNIIDGKKTFTLIKEKIKNEINVRKNKGLKIPGIAMIIVGNDPSSCIYVQHKNKACNEVGFISKNYALSEHISNTDLLTLIEKLNCDYNIDGILVQLPLPQHINNQNVIEAINPHKDIDGFHPYNIGRLMQRHPLLRPCTSKGIMLMLQGVMNNNIKGKHAVIIGASNIVGRPMSMELMLAGATVTVCHKFTINLNKYIKMADIIIVAVGKPNFIKKHQIFKKKSIIIDVGINRCNNGHVIGDVDFKNIAHKVSYITPVPGGVGPMTVAMLLENTLIACKDQHD